MIDTNITITASVTTKMSYSFYHVITITTIAANTNVDNSTNITNVVMQIIFLPLVCISPINSW